MACRWQNDWALIAGYGKHEPLPKRYLDETQEVIYPLALVRAGVTRHLNADHSVNWAAAQSAVTAKVAVEMIKGAASRELIERAKIEQARVATPGDQGAAYDQALRTVRAKFPGLQQAADTGALSVESLKMICWSKLNASGK